jgi:hypothetical protein
MGVQKYKYGPILTGTVGLIVGKSGLTNKGMQVFPGGEDEDYTVEDTSSYVT